MNAPYFVKLPSGIVVNLSAIAYCNNSGQVIYDGHDTVYKLDAADTAALRSWLDASAVDLSAPPLNEGMTMMVDAARSVLESDGQDKGSARNLAEMVLDQFEA